MQPRKESVFLGTKGKEFPLVNPFLFASAITFLPLLNASIDYEGACPFVVPQKTKNTKNPRLLREKKRLLQWVKPLYNPLSFSFLALEGRTPHILSLALEGRGLG